MRISAISVLALAVGPLSITMPLFAHHGTAMFDTNKTLSLKGSRYPSFCTTVSERVYITVMDCES